MGLRCFLNGFRIGQDQCRSYWPDNAAKMRDFLAGKQRSRQFAGFVTQEVSDQCATTNRCTVALSPSSTRNR